MATQNLNMFLVENRVSAEFILLTIVVEVPLPSARVYLMDFRAYTKEFEDNRWFQNSNSFRSTLTIALGPLPHRCSDQIFMSLVTEKRLDKKK